MSGRLGGRSNVAHKASPGAQFPTSGALQIGAGFTPVFTRPLSIGGSGLMVSGSWPTANGPRYWTTSQVYNGSPATPGTAFLFVVIQRRSDSVTPSLPTLIDDDFASTPVHILGETWSSGTNRGRVDLYILETSGAWTVDTGNTGTKTVDGHGLICSDVDTSRTGLSNVSVSNSGTGSGTALHGSETLVAPLNFWMAGVVTFNAHSGAAMTVTPTDGALAPFTTSGFNHQDYDNAFGYIFSDYSDPFTTDVDFDWNNLTGDWAWFFVSIKAPGDGEVH